MRPVHQPRSPGVADDAAQSLVLLLLVGEEVAGYKLAVELPKGQDEVLRPIPRRSRGNRLEGLATPLATRGLNWKSSPVSRPLLPLSKNGGIRISFTTNVD